MTSGASLLSLQLYVNPKGPWREGARLQEETLSCRYGGDPRSGSKQGGKRGLLLLFSPSVMSLFHSPMDCSPPGSSVHGISQARIQEWIAISFSVNLPDPGIELVSPTLAGGFFTTELPGKPNKGSRPK